MICVADWTVSAVLEDRYLPCRVLSRGTAGQYRWAVSHFDRLCGPRCGGPVTLSRLSMELLCHYVRLGLAEGTSMATLKRRVAVIRTLWDFAEAEGLTSSRACRPLKLREPRRIPNAWRPGELAAIEAACDRWRPSKYGRPHSKLWTAKHWRALLALILDTGERIDALIKCKRVWFCPRRRVLYVAAEARKNQQQDREYPLSAATAALVAALPSCAGGWLFPRGPKVQTLRLQLKKILADAGLPASRRHLFHCWRRTHGTFVAIVAGKEAARKSLGHTSLATTERYLDSSQLDDVRACDLVAQARRRKAV